MAERRHSDDRTDGQGRALKRRGLIAGAAALVAGIVAKQTSQPVSAAAGPADYFTATGSADTGFLTSGSFRNSFSSRSMR